MPQTQTRKQFVPSTWWEQIAGTLADNSAYDEAMRLGREYRDSLRSSSTEASDD